MRPSGLERRVRMEEQGVKINDARVEQLMDDAGNADTQKTEPYGYFGVVRVDTRSH